MRIEELDTYGKDLLTIMAEKKVPFKQKMRILGPALGMVVELIISLGLKKLPEFIRTVKSEISQAQAMDWQELYQRGISKSDVDAVIKKICLAKVMADFLGMDAAAGIRQRFSQKSSFVIMSQMFASPEVFVECGQGDFLAAFKPYYIAMMDAMARRGLEFFEVPVDEPDRFQLNVTYCAWAEVAKRLGNPQYCYFSTCYGDEVFFPKLCEAVGFDFRREGSLGTGAPVCDFYFERRK
jgi:hypothetical protein